MRPTTLLFVLVIPVALAIAAPALAGDGASEINQTCAVQTGCFPGDAAGFPVQITTPGSYRLTSNLDVPDANTTAIQVRASSVNIDMEGFSIVGVTQCDWSNNTCTNTGSGIGVQANISGVANVTLENGSIRGMGATGADLGSGGLIEGVTAASNGGNGLSMSSGVIQNSTAYENGFIGIQGAYSVVRNVTASRNLSHGIAGGFGINVIDSNASFNRGFGLDLPSTGGLGRPGSYSGCNLQVNNYPTGTPQLSGGLRTGSSICGNAYCP